MELYHSLCFHYLVHCHHYLLCLLTAVNLLTFDFLYRYGKDSRPLAPASRMNSVILPKLLPYNMHLLCTSIVLLISQHCLRYNNFIVVIQVIAMLAKSDAQTAPYMKHLTLWRIGHNVKWFRRAIIITKCDYAHLNSRRNYWVYTFFQIPYEQWIQWLLFKPVSS